MSTHRNPFCRRIGIRDLLSRVAGAAFLWLACATVADAQILEIEAKAIASGPQILLQDIVRAGSTLPEGWGERAIGEAPLPKETRDLTLTEIAEAMNGYEDMRRVVLRGKSVVRVEARHRAVDVERIQAALDRYVQEHAEWKDRRFEVDPDQPPLASVPPGTLSVDVLSIQKSPDTGNMGADVRLTVDGTVFGGDPLRVELAEMRPFWAAARPLARGESLVGDSVEKRWVSERNAARFYSADRSLEGMELRRSVQTGQMLAIGMLAEPLYAKRGEIVRVISQRGGLTVTLRARALSDGRRDERILCVNEQSGKRMNVRLVHPHRALLEEGTGDIPT